MAIREGAGAGGVGGGKEAQGRVGKVGIKSI